MEHALSDSGENVNHGIDSFLLRLVSQIHHSQSVRHKFSVEERIHHPQLDYDVDQTEQFADPVPERVQLVTLKVKTRKISRQKGIFLHNHVENVEKHARVLQQQSSGELYIKTRGFFFQCKTQFPHPMRQQWRLLFENEAIKTEASRSDMVENQGSFADIEILIVNSLTLRNVEFDS